MQFTSALFALLAVTGAMAAPSQEDTRQVQGGVTVKLAGGQGPDRVIIYNGRQVQSAEVGAAFRTVTLTIAPGAADPALRCQLIAADKNIILVDRGTNKNKKTFGDGGKGAWNLDVAGDGIARVQTVVCNPAFKNE